MEIQSAAAAAAVAEWCQLQRLEADGCIVYNDLQQEHARLVCVRVVRYATSSVAAAN